jgi:hypothetical protein
MLTTNDNWQGNTFKNMKCLCKLDSQLFSIAAIFFNVYHLWICLEYHYIMQMTSLVLIRWCSFVVGDGGMAWRFESLPSCWHIWYRKFLVIVLEFIPYTLHALQFYNIIFHHSITSCKYNLRQLTMWDLWLVLE